MAAPVGSEATAAAAADSAALDPTVDAETLNNVWETMGCVLETDAISTREERDKSRNPFRDAAKVQEIDALMVSKFPQTFDNAIRVRVMFSMLHRLALRDSHAFLAFATRIGGALPFGSALPFFLDNFGLDKAAFERHGDAAFSMQKRAAAPYQLVQDRATAMVLFNISTPVPMDQKTALAALMTFVDLAARQVTPIFSVMQSRLDKVPMFLVVMAAMDALRSAVIAMLVYALDTMKDAELADRVVDAWVYALEEAAGPAVGAL